MAVLGLVLLVGGSPAFAQSVKEKEGATVIRQGPNGEVQVLSTEKTTRTDGGTAVAGEGQALPKPPRPVTTVEDPSRKARVMVIPAIIMQEQRRRIDRELNERFGITDAGIIESPGYTSFIIDALVNARKFDMVEREELRSVIKELNFGESDYADPEKVVRIGQLVGADFMVVPEIRYLQIMTETKAIPYVGGSQVSIRCKVATAVRTVNVKSGKIVSSNIKEVEKIKRCRQTDQPETVRTAALDLMADTFRESGLREAANIVDVAYPIRVMSITGDTVMLNRGMGAILEGETLKVFATGEVMVDPDTKENLGYHEAYVATIKVTEVDQKTSKAVVVEKVGEIERLSLCRRMAPPTLDNPALKRSGGEPPAPTID
jgi:curli biogenesis system outer membrane secretion channel CsgG